jgi:hypothetical protein
MSDKKFANLHYPGMKADPREGASILPLAYEQRMHAQIAALGIEAQQKIFSYPTLLMGSNALNFAIAQNLLALGFGRIAILGDQASATGHFMTDEPSLQTPALAHQRTKNKVQNVSTYFETYAELSLERKFEDIEKAFQTYVTTCHPSSQAFAASISTHPKPTLFAWLRGNSAGVELIPADHGGEVRSLLEKHADPLTTCDHSLILRIGLKAAIVLMDIALGATPPNRRSWQYSPENDSWISKN